MNTHDKKSETTLTLMEAVETLSHIADLQEQHNLGIAEKHDLVVANRPLQFHTIHWLNNVDAEETVSIVRDTFKVILKYLRDFYKYDYHEISDPHTLEGIKTVMVLVGEAAKKLDKYTAMFFKKRPESVTELKEYKKLQDFYLTRIAHKIDEGTLGKWIWALSQKKPAVEKKVALEGKRKDSTKHVFMDLESVKMDTEYELFFLRKEDGTRFFNPRLIRNIKLISDFGGYIGEGEYEDPLSSVSIWNDRTAFHFAGQIMSSMKKQIMEFYSRLSSHPGEDLVDLLSKAIIALMMAAKHHNLSHDSTVKNCIDYFRDFQLYLRQCLLSREYQNLIAYPERADRWSDSVLNLVHDLCYAVYASMTWSHEMTGMIHSLLDEARETLSPDHRKAIKSAKSLGSRICGEYAAMSKLLKHHMNGPLNKILDTLENGDYHTFDPYMQGSVPMLLYRLYVQNKEYLIANWPSVTHQEYIDKAIVNEEFKAFLRSCLGKSTFKKVLILNFQDRVSWREQSRCDAIEGISKIEGLGEKIDVVTLSKDTEFYNQVAPYNQENRADIFMANFKKQVKDHNFGFQFPKWMHEEIDSFAGECIAEIHKVFFSGKNMLLREDRLDFIEIFYTFLELKVIDLVQPDIVGICCKDGLDVTSMVSAQLFIFMKLLNQEWLSENDHEFIDMMIYGPCMLSRERIVMSGRFNRMASLIKAIESVRMQYGFEGFLKVVHQAFGKLYQKPFLKGKVASTS